MAEPVLADTSVWVDHLRRGNAELVALLEAGLAHVHPFVIGELACGNLAQRAEVLALLAELPRAPVLDHARVLAVLEREKLMGRGLGFIDVSLLASASKGGLELFTLDRRLAAAARDLALPSKPART